MEIVAQKRTIKGSKVKRLRKKGIIPCSLYGKKVNSQNIQVDEKAFLKIYSYAGDTKLIDLKVENDKTYPVLIHQIQKHPVNLNILSVDFLAVSLKDVVKVFVPVVPLGTPKAVSEKIGVCLQPLQEIEIECLPTDLPEKIEADVTSLSKIGDVLTVSDIKVSDKIKILSDASQVVFTISDLVQKEKVEEEVTPHEAEAITQKKTDEAEQKDESAKEEIDREKEK